MSLPILKITELGTNPYTKRRADFQSLHDYHGCDLLNNGHRYMVIKVGGSSMNGRYGYHTTYNQDELIIVDIDYPFGSITLGDGIAYARRIPKMAYVSHEAYDIWNLPIPADLGAIVSPPPFVFTRGTSSVIADGYAVGAISEVYELCTSEEDYPQTPEMGGSQIKSYKLFGNYLGKISKFTPLECPSFINCDTTKGSTQTY